MWVCIPSTDAHDGQRCQIPWSRNSSGCEFPDIDVRKQTKVLYKSSMY